MSTEKLSENIFMTEVPGVTRVETEFANIYIHCSRHDREEPQIEDFVKIDFDFYAIEGAGVDFDTRNITDISRQIKDIERSPQMKSVIDNARINKSTVYFVDVPYADYAIMSGLDSIAFYKKFESEINITAGLFGLGSLCLFAKMLQNKNYDP